MAFVVSELTALLRVDKGSYDADLASAKQGLDRLADGARSAGQNLSGHLKSGLTAASVATGVVAAGATALVAKVTSVGASYNILQQTSRAALKTIMGDGEKAAAQMDKLDDFARNSPFAKDVFIKGQQQLLAFGLEAKKVIPIMDGVQQAVAATGGTNVQLSEVISVLAKMSSTGKITTEDLNMLGERGINAAKILSESFGKSEKDIRASITKGKIGADEAIDALTTGMQKKFGGATDLIKAQMTGALDRVKGATRDIGAALVEPFIKQEGGGRAVVWTNEFADALRALERKAGPLTQMLVGRLNPAFNSFSYMLQDAKGWIDQINVRDLDVGLDKLSKHAPAIAGLSAAFAAMGTQLPILSRLGLSVNPLVAGIVALVAASPELRGVFQDAVEAGKPLGPIIAELATHFSTGLNAGISATIPLLESGVQVFGNMVQASGPVVDMVGNLVKWFSELPEPVQTALVAFAGFAALRGKFDWVSDLGSTLGTTVVGGFQKFRAEMDGLHAMKALPIDQVIGKPLVMLDRQISLTADNSRRGFGRITDAARVAGKGIASGLGNATRGIMNLFGGPWGLAIGAGVMALGAYSQAQAEARARTAEFKGTLDETTGAITENTSAMVASALAGDEGSKGFWLWSSGAESAADTLKLLGRSVEDTSNVVAKGGSEYDNMIQVLRDYESAVSASADQVDNFGNVISRGDGGAALREWQELMGLSNEAMAELNAADMSHLIGQLEQQRDAIGGATRSWEMMNDSVQTAPEVQSRLADAIAAVGDTAADSTTRLEAYKTIIDALNGVVPDQEESQRRLATTGRTLGEFFSEAGESGKLLHSGLIDAKTGAVEFSDAGDRLMGILSPMRDEALAAALAAADHEKALGNEAGAAAAAEAALEPYRAQIQQLATDGKITQEQADALSASLFGIPGETTVAITDEGSAEALSLKLQDLYAMVMAAPEGEIVISDNSPEIVAGLEALGFTVTHLPDGKIKVSETGTDETGRKIDGTAKKPRKATITAEAATAAAEKALANAARDRSSTVFQRVVTSHEERWTTGRGGRGGQTAATGRRLPHKAGGGKLPRTNLGTDQILGINSKGVPTAWVDDEEWVVNKRSSSKWDALLRLINRDDPRLESLMKLGHLGAYASGGRVGWSQGQDKDLLADYRRAVANRKDSQKDLKQAERAVSQLQNAYSKIGSGKANKARKEQAKRELEAAKRWAKNEKQQLDRLEKIEDTAKKRLEDSKARTSRLSESTFDLRRDIKRGSIMDAFMSGSGMSQVDQLFSQSNNKDLSKTQRSRLRSTAYSIETQLLKLEKQSESLAEKLDKARQKRDELLNVKNNIANNLAGEWGLGNMLQWDTLKDGPLTAGDIAKGAREKAAQIKLFAKKLNDLRKKGYNSLVIQDVASLGTNEGTLVADALLAGSNNEIRDINKSFTGIETYSGQAGENVTKSMYQGGQAAADGLVKGLESKEKQVEKAFAALAKKAEAAFKKALGIRSPSSVMFARAGDTADGYILGLKAKQREVEQQMEALAQLPKLVRNTDPSIAQHTRGHADARQITVHNYNPVAEPASTTIEKASSLLQL